MKAKIAFDFYHDGINPTRYEPGDDVPEDVAVPVEWVEESATVIDDPGDDVPEVKHRGKKGK